MEEKRFAPYTRGILEVDQRSLYKFPSSRRPEQQSILCRLYSTSTLDIGATIAFVQHVSYIGTEGTLLYSSPEYLIHSVEQNNVAAERQGNYN